MVMDVDDPRAAGLIDDLYTAVDFEEAHRGSLERFLISNRLDTSYEALTALSQGPEFRGYSADALALHSLVAMDGDLQLMFGGLSFLRQMRNNGEVDASRILTLLESVNAWRKYIGE